MKTVLQVKKHLTFGSLLVKLIKSGILPDYYEEFSVHFEKVSLGTVKERNRTGEGHGQGTEQLEVSRSLAEFAVNVAGTINPFLIKRWLEIRFEEEPDENELAF